MQILNAGAPLYFPILKEPTFVSPAVGAIGVPTKFSNPNAANWLLTKEGQAVFSRANGILSQRLDVPTEGFNPVLLPHPGEKLIVQDEEFTLYMGKMQEVAKQIIGEANRK